MLADCHCQTMRHHMPREFIGLLYFARSRQRASCTLGSHNEPIGDRARSPPSRPRRGNPRAHATPFPVAAGTHGWRPDAPRPPARYLCGARVKSPPVPQTNAPRIRASETAKTTKYPWSFSCQPFLASVLLIEAPSKVCLVCATSVGIFSFTYANEYRRFHPDRGRATCGIRCGLGR